MSKSRFIILSTLIISCLFFYACIRDKNPAGVNDNIPEYENYINSWPDTIFALGVGAPNPDVPPAAQRATALRAAKIDLLHSLLNIVNKLPVSSKQTVNDLMIENDLIASQIFVYIKGFEILDTAYLSTGYVEVWGCILTEDLKTILIPYLSE